jgi:capsular polysaccharide biosynthesis protein
MTDPVWSLNILIGFGLFFVIGVIVIVIKEAISE